MSAVTLERRDAVDAAAAGMMVFLTFFWGLNGVAAKLANAGYNPMLVVAIRSALGGALVLCWCWRRRIPLLGRDRSLGPGILAGALFGGEFLLIYFGLEFTTVGRSALLVNTMPFWVLLGAHFFLGERMSTRALAGLALAFCGVAIIFSDRLGAANPNAIVGDLLSLGAGIAWASTTIVIKRTQLAVISAEKLLLYQLAMAALVGLAFLPLAGDALRNATLTATAALLFQGLFVVPVTYLLWMWLMRRYPAGGLASFVFLSPAFGVLCGAVLLGEPLTLRIGVSLVLIAVGLLVVNRPSRKPAGLPI